MIALIKSFFFWITFGSFRAKRKAVRRRANYDLIKSEISKRHFMGYVGLTVDLKGLKIDAVDRSSFKAPMYGWVKNQKGQWCVFWDRSRMTKEIGTGAPLQDGEVVTDSDAKVRTKPDGSPDTIDEQTPLTHQIEDNNGEKGNA